MPLLDHFHPPISEARHWESLHGFWASILGERLNLSILPPGYYAEIQVHVGSRIEVDVATFEEDHLSRRQASLEKSTSSSVATLAAPTEVWSPPEPDLSFPAIFPDVFETLVYRKDAGPSLVGAIELVSPGNKDRPEARRAFAAKCSTYLQAGVGLVIVDIVTNRLANLHDELIELLELGESSKMAGSPPLYAAAYRPIRRGSEESVQVWLSGLDVGRVLPTLPLALRAGPCLPIELESTYSDLCRRARFA